MPNKAEREGYDESPFFNVDLEYPEGRLVCWPGDAHAQERLFKSLVAIVGRRIDYLLKEHVATEGEQFIWRRISGGILSQDLDAVLDTDRDLFFHDGAIQACFRHPETGEYFAYDEHGLFWIYGADPQWKKALLAAGVQERTAELLGAQPHWHVRPKDAERRLAAFLEVLKKRSQFCHEDPPK